MLFGPGGTALAQCTGGAGTTTCSGNPATFPSGGAAPVGTDATLDVNSLTGNIVPSSGVAGAAILSNAPVETINLQGSGSTFQINTTGAIGINAQSVGQTGSTGSTGVSVLLVPGIGGPGGPGGNGGNIFLTATGGGTIFTTGTNQHAIEGLSQGGAGGQGGNCIGIIGVLCSAGNGGQSGSPGTVTINNVLNLSTTGVGAVGIWAQSIGAPGGPGGTSGGLCAVCLGGSGAAASDGQAVTVTDAGTIITSKNGAIGIFAQSIGGYAGSGGGAFGIGLSFGAGTSSAGSGGTAIVTDNGGSITTGGIGASDIYAQSVGGGGGSAGTGGGLVGFSSNGGSGGAGGNVTVQNAATLVAGGNQSSGIYAQSVGGGGGSGGNAGGLVAIGGSGSNGSVGGDVEVDNSGNITTRGSGDFSNPSSATLAAGIFAQSIGGSGGDGAAAGGLVAIGGNGSSGEDGGTVTVVNSGIIKSECGGNCTGTSAIFAQSVGGGGGNGGGTGGLAAIGGSGGAAGNGNFVNITNTGNLTSVGSDSAALFAQSVGGGGGNGGFAVGAGVFASFGFGGSGGAGGQGGNVCVNASGVCSANAATYGNVPAGLAPVPPSTPSEIQTAGDTSAGILAQSIGGGGGNGGFAVSGSVGLYGDVSVAVGGPGGSGGAAGYVLVGSSGTIATDGMNSPGIDAESIGGGGGNGGFTISISASTGGALGATFAGNGGTGSTGGTVIVNSATDVTTQQDLSDGIFARSIGGGGGNGGFAVTGSGGVFGAASLSFGGGGGGGGDAQDVDVTSSGTIVTHGMQSAGIAAESIGGGGGNGGFAVSASGAQYGALSLSFGGAGGDGGKGANASVTSSGNITTTGDMSDAIIAQSIGGGGGDGGFSVGAALTVSTGASGALAVGGDGGSGGTAGNAQVSSIGDIRTSGANSVGIFAQSVGGSGGNGGFSGALSLAKGVALGAAIGGNGGSGNAAGAATVTSVGNITTTGDNATNILVQSLGGGGGNGAFALMLAATMNKSAIGVAQGGTGGSTGAGGTVTVASSGTIQTGGNLADGIDAQSVGGGGGNGGFSVGASLSFDGSTNIDSVGGNGGTGNIANQVSVTAASSASSSTPGYSIITTGNGAVGIFAQSIGGGGGNGGFAIAGSFNAGSGASGSAIGGTGGTGGNSVNIGTAGSAGYVPAVQVTDNGSISTAGTNASAIEAQSIGGGGGNGAFSIGISGTVSDSKSKLQTVGGSGGAAGNGGDVVVNANVAANSAAVIATAQDLSYGVLAQSIGGGGGNGGFAVAGSLSTGGGAAANATGGNGTGGGNAGLVTVTMGGAIVTGTPVFSSDVVVGSTGGEGSAAILAQSIGGGGGSGGFSGGLALGIGGDSATNTTGGQGGVGGSGGNVTVTTLAGASITTFGDNAPGIVAQSIGGGGGNGGFSIGAAFTGSDGDSATNTVGGNAGDGSVGGNVTVTNAAAITTFGLLSNGIVAQSVGGGGGNGGFAVSGSLSFGGNASSNTTGGSGGKGADAGTVAVTNTGAIAVNAAGTIGILAQSIGGGGGNGGFAGGLTFTDSNSAMTNAVGGQGAGAGNGAAVTVTNSAAITASGDQGIGILAQSVGGGGGNGAFAISVGGSSEASSQTENIGGDGGAGGNGSDVTVTNNAGGTITTNGAMAYGIVAQSVGGGGGNGGFSVAGGFSLGGDAKSTVGGGAGGNGGSAGTVTVDNFDSITTQGVNSTGILAQSIGGGGGTGGFAGGLTFSSNGEANNTVGGGSGGNGNTPSSVTVTNHAGASIATMQANSFGILAQAIAGGGGAGGFAISGAASTGGDGLSQGVGGTGGTGASVPNGVLVKVVNDGTITTKGALSYGIYAQSIGGGGGVGGFSVSGAYSSSGGSTGSVGAKGGAGGDGGDVVVTNSGTIIVGGAGSVGIYAQSVGGGGGAAGFSGALNFTSGGNLTNTVGGGGSGGSGGNVTVTSTGSIETIGPDSVAVIAQSIAGGGGSAAYSISAQDGSSITSDLQIGQSSGGTPGSTGIVTVNISNGVMLTGGDLSYGLLAQGVGGGGGNSALSVPDPLTLNAGGINQTVGATGGAAANGLVVNSTNASSIATSGAGAIGYIGQSVGGGGGTAGVTGDVDFTTSGPMTFTAGGTSTGGGSGGATTVTNSAPVVATGVAPLGLAGGDAAVGILAQSIGGGGGSVLYALGNVTGAPASMIGENLGGAEGGTNNGGQLVFASGGIVSTTGRFAAGVVAQTIGGGGGYGAFTAATGIAVGPAGVQLALGSSGGSGGSADPSGTSTWTINSGSITTTGKLSDGLVAQAIGGGGGLGGFASDGSQAPPLTQVTLGATGGAGGNGSVISLTNASTITTTNVGAVGLIGQSIGGGGGVAQVFGVSGAGPVTLGASGGAGGNAEDVSISSDAAITTSGVDAHALIAQSIGGGGGLFLGFDASGNPIAANIQAGSGSGNTGNVTVDNNGNIRTTGDGAYGILAQSIAGGGGVVGGGAFATTLPATGSFAGSAGGVGAAGTVSINNQANVVVTGAGATAIFAQSADRTGLGGNIDITIGDSTTGTNQLVSGGTGGGNAVALVGGATNTLTNFATLTTSADVSGMTIAGGVGDEAVTNYGHMIGSIGLGTGSNSIDNKPYNSIPSTSAGVFDSGATINLGGNAAPDRLTNEGLVSTGAFLTVMTTNETGNFTQTATGSCGTFGSPTSACGYLGIDLDLNNNLADRLNATGAANVDGAVVVNVDNAGSATPGSNTLTILSAALGETHPSTLALQAFQTAVASYSLTYPNATDIDLQYSINFSPAGLTQNQHSVGNAVNAIQTAHVAAFAPIANALFYQPTVAALGAVYDSLSGEGVTATEQTAIEANDIFHSSILQEAGFWVFGADASDPNSLTSYAAAPLASADSGRKGPDLVVKAPPAAPARTWRAWTTFNRGDWRYSGDPVVGSAATRESGGGFAGGLDYQVSPNFLVGGAIGYGEFSANVPDRATSDHVDATHVAVYGAARSRRAYAIAMLDFDYFTNRESRIASVPGTVLPPLFGMTIPPVPGFSENDTGRFASQSVSGLLEAGYRYELGGINVTPLAGAQFTYLWMNSFTETNTAGPSTIGLAFPSRAIPSVPAYLGAQFDGKTSFGGELSLYGWMRAEWVHEFEAQRSIDPSFIVAPGFNFVIEGATPAVDLARINTGVKLNVSRHVSFTAGFDADLYRTPSYSGWGGFRVSW